MSHKLPSGRRASRTGHAHVMQHSASRGSQQPSITLASSSIRPRGSQSQKPQNPTRLGGVHRKRNGKQSEWEIMELCVSTTASSVRATAAHVSFAPLRRGAFSSTAALPLHRRIPARGWRCASSAGPDPVPSDGPASATYTFVFTDKPDTPPANDKVEEVGAAPSASAEAPVAEPVSSEPSPSPSPDDGGLGEILSKLNIEVTPTLILTGSGAFLALWILSSIVAAIDSVPLLPKLLELVGTGYSIWFTARYLLFKESRDDLFAKFEDFIQRII